MSAIIKFAICDDEPAMVATIETMLAEYLRDAGEDYAVRAYSSGEILLGAFSCLGADDLCDILFIDVKMSGITGIEAARHLRETGGRDTVIIFITGMERHMQDAFDVRAFHYLLKPVGKAKFADALRRAIAEVKHLRQYEDAFLTTAASGMLQKVYLRELYYVDSYQKKATFHTANGDIGHYAALDEIENQLDSSFFRCNRGTIVNLRHVRGYPRRRTLDFGIYKIRYAFASEH